MAAGLKKRSSKISFREQESARERDAEEEKRARDHSRIKRASTCRGEAKRENWLQCFILRHTMPTTSLSPASAIVYTWKRE